VRRERETACNAEIGGKRLGAPIVVESIHRTFKSTGDVDAAITIHRHRGRINDGGGIRFSSPVWRDSKDRNRDLLSARAAVSQIQVSRAIDQRIVDLMKTCGNRHPQLDAGVLDWSAVDGDRAGAPLGNS